ncbi:type II secretion system protein GspL [Pseudomonas sp. NPDC090202]|uniref:type II secretion system protein GspL n=1 Tax=unclassified Pseudomonas TaxID=196821 RepID=UPI0037FC27DB
MSHWLYLTPPGLRDVESPWPVRCWSDAQPLRTGTLEEAGQIFHGERVRVVLPMEACSWLRSPLWPGRRRPSAQALAYAVEEQLGEDLDALHIAVGVPDEQRRYPLLVINARLFQRILQTLHEAGIQPLSVQIDADLLPDDQPYVLRWAGRWLLGGALEARLALTDAALHIIESRLPDNVCRYDVDQPSAQAEIGKLLRSEKAIDLLQGEFRPQRKRWRWAPFVTAAACVFWLSWAALLIRSQHLESLAERLYAQSVQQFQALYPQQTRIVDLDAQFSAAQGSVVQEQGQMKRLVQLAEQVIGGGDVEVLRTEFGAGEGWKLTLSAASFKELERLRERAAQAGLLIRLDSASKVRDGVQAVLIMGADTP